MDTAQCQWTASTAESKTILIDNYKDLFLVREQQTCRIFNDNTSINRFVISEAILMTLELLFQNWINDSKLYSINTGGFFITNPKNQYENNKEVEFKVENIGPAYITNSKAKGKRYLQKFQVRFNNLTLKVNKKLLKVASQGLKRTN